MNRNTLHTAVEWAHRFIERANAWEAKHKADAERVSERKAVGDKYAYHSDLPKESAAIKRASMDLTRALADLRRPG